MNQHQEKIDVLRELINIGIGRAAGMLNEMLDAHVTLQVPVVRVFLQKDLERKVGEVSKNILSAVRMGFRGPLKGNAFLLFPPESASNLVSVLTGEDPVEDDMDSIRIGTLTEVGNILINCVMGSISNVVERQLNYSVPNYFEDSLSNMLTRYDENSPDVTIILASMHFIIEQHFINGDIMLFFELGSFDVLIDCLGSLIEKTR